MSRTGGRVARFSALAVALAATAAVSVQAASGQGVTTVELVSGNPLQEPVITAFVNVPVRAGGSLTVSFHGDPGTGCAAEGVCGMTGEVSWSPDSQGNLSVVESRIGRRTTVAASLGLNELGFGNPGGATNARVTWSAPGSATAGPGSAAAGPGQSSCADAQATGDDIPLVRRGGRFEVMLASASPSLVQTRCGGPLASDLGSLVPGLSVSLRQILRGERTLHLTGSHSFASHGFAGTVVSSITLRLGRARRSQPQPPPLRGSGSAQREIDLIDTARLSGSVETSFSGDASPSSCAPLGACGLSGTEVLAPELSTVAHLVVYGPASRPKRDLLAALGLSRTGRAGTVGEVGPLGFATWNAGGTLTTQLQENALTCADQEPLGPGSLELARKGEKVEVAYDPGADLGEAPLLRSRCPGPFGPQTAALATATIPLRDLARHRLTIRLTHRTSFSDDGYSLRSVPDLLLTLTRKRLVTTTFETYSSISPS